MRTRRGIHRKRGEAVKNNVFGAALVPASQSGSFECGTARCRGSKIVANRGHRHSSFSASSPILTHPSFLTTTLQYVDTRPRAHISVKGRLSSRREDQTGMDESQPGSLKAGRIRSASRHQCAESEWMRLRRNRSIVSHCSTRIVFSLDLFCYTACC